MSNVYLVSHWELVKHDLLDLIPKLDVYMPFGASARMLVDGVMYMNPYVYIVPDSKLLTYFQLRNIGNYASRPLTPGSAIQYFS
jgi:hypothetical protein